MGEMRILFVSDVHYEHDYHHNIWEGDAKAWLIKVIERQKPIVMIGAGDWGHAWTAAEWREITDLVETHAIYGNHDNLISLKKATNPKSKHKHVWAHDGEKRTIEGLTFGFINGIIAKKEKIKGAVPRTLPDTYLNYADRIAGCDIMVTHMAPREMAWDINRIHEAEDLVVMKEAIRIAHPKILMCGHLGGPYTLVGNITGGGTYGIRVDSSPAERHYGILSHKGTSIEVWKDWEKVTEATIPL